MNRENAKMLLPIIQAFAEGKTIEFQTADGDWTPSGTPSFNYDHNRYRIKPEPRTIRVLYNKTNAHFVTVYPSGQFSSLTGEELLNKYNNYYPQNAPFTLATFVEKLD